MGEAVALRGNLVCQKGGIAENPNPKIQNGITNPCFVRLTMVVTILPILGLILAQGGGLLADLPERFRPNAPSGDKVVLKVNGIDIKAGEVDNLLWNWKANEVIEEMVNYALVKQDAASKNIYMGVAEAEAEYNRRIEGMKKGLNGQTLEAALAEQGFTESRLYLRLLTELLTNRVLEKTFSPADWVKVSTIVFPARTGSVDELQAAIKAANEGYAKLKGGTAWETILGGTRPDAEILKTGGAVGWRPLTAFPEAAQAEMKAGKAGGFVKPVQTNNGLQIFRIDGKGAGASPELLAELKPVYLQTARGSYLAGLKSKAKIDRPQ
jgi:hypothetical protein